MNTYEITTTHGTFRVEGDCLEVDHDDLNGGVICYKVSKHGKPVAYVPGGELVSSHIVG